MKYVCNISSMLGLCLIPSQRYQKQLFNQVDIVEFDVSMECRSRAVGGKMIGRWFIMLAGFGRRAASFGPEQHFGPRCRLL
jgi:hypothetical protein